MSLPLTAKRTDSFCYRLCCLVVCLLISSGSIAKKEEPLNVVVTSAFINIYTGRGRGFPIFHVLEKGEIFTLIKSKTDWIKVITEDNIEGWVHRNSMGDTVGANGEEVLLGIPERSDYRNRNWEFGIGFGEFENISSLGFHTSYRMTENLSAELRYTQGTGNSSNNKLLSLGLVHQPFPEWKISPFFTLANGQLEISPNSNLSQSQDQEDHFFMAGTGFHYHFTHRFMIRFEYNNYTTLPDRDNNENVDEWKLGLSAFF